MIGLDTNLLVRYLVQDDPIQSEKVNRFIEESVEVGKTLWICHITLCETVWVLDRSYKLSKQEIIHILQEILQTPQIKVERDDIVWIALRDYEVHTSVGFADCLIGEQNVHNSCLVTYTLGKAAAKKLPIKYKSLL